MVTHILASGERLLQDVYVRCADESSHGDRVYVGLFVSDGLGVNDSWDGFRINNLGWASSRKF